MSVLVYGQQVPGLPEEEIALGVIVLVKTIDGDGQHTIALRNSEELTTIDRIGMLTVALDRARAEAQEGWHEEGGEE